MITKMFIRVRLCIFTVLLANESMGRPFTSREETLWPSDVLNLVQHSQEIDEDGGWGYFSHDRVYKGREKRDISADSDDPASDMVPGRHQPDTTARPHSTQHHQDVSASGHSAQHHQDVSASGHSTQHHQDVSATGHSTQHHQDVRATGDSHGNSARVEDAAADRSSNSLNDASPGSSSDRSDSDPRGSGYDDASQADQSGSPPGDTSRPAAATDRGGGVDAAQSESSASPDEATESNSSQDRSPHNQDGQSPDGPPSGHVDGEGGPVDQGADSDQIGGTGAVLTGSDDVAGDDQSAQPGETQHDTNGAGLADHGDSSDDVEDNDQQDANASDIDHDESIPALDEDGAGRPRVDGGDDTFNGTGMGKDPSSEDGHGDSTFQSGSTSDNGSNMNIHTMDGNGSPDDGGDSTGDGLVPVDPKSGRVSVNTSIDTDNSTELRREGNSSALAGVSGDRTELHSVDETNVSNISTTSRTPTVLTPHTSTVSTDTRPTQSDSARDGEVGSPSQGGEERRPGPETTRYQEPQHTEAVTTARHPESHDDIPVRTLEPIRRSDTSSFPSISSSSSSPLPASTTTLDIRSNVPATVLTAHTNNDLTRNPTEPRSDEATTPSRPVQTNPPVVTRTTTRSTTTTTSSTMTTTALPSTTTAAITSTIPIESTAPVVTEDSRAAATESHKIIPAASTTALIPTNITSTTPSPTTTEQSTENRTPHAVTRVTRAAQEVMPSTPNETTAPPITTPGGGAGSGTTVEPPVTEVSPHALVELKFDLTWAAFCDSLESILQELVGVLRVEADRQELSRGQIHLDDAVGTSCQNAADTEGDVSIQIYLMNNLHAYDRQLTLKCLEVLQRAGETLSGTTILRDKLIEVDLHTGTTPGSAQEGNSPRQGDNPGETPPGQDSRHKDRTKEHEEKEDTVQVKEKGQQAASQSANPFSDPGVTVAVILACIGVVSCLAVVALQIAVRRRKQMRKVLKRTLNRSESMNSSDSIQLAAVTKSRPNSGLFNPALDITDSVLEPSHQMNFAQLANFCSDQTKVEAEFEKLPNRMPRLSVVPTGEEDKNRFANVLPLALTRVKLLQDGPEPRSSYINANYITGPDNQCQYYIATQAPTEETIADFWTMIWQQGTRAIVMLTQMEEDGQKKCTPYWPDFVGKSAAQKHGDFLIELSTKEVCQEYIASELKLTHLRKIESRPIFHFWYTCWPCKSLPEPISLVKLVLDSRTKYEDAAVPVVVHCSPGTGRTGTFIALDQCMHQFETRRTVDVMKTVYSLRQERAGAVQSREQYTLLYQAAREYASIIESPGVSAASSATTLHALLPSS